MYHQPSHHYSDTLYKINLKKKVFKSPAQKEKNTKIKWNGIKQQAAALKEIKIKKTSSTMCVTIIHIANLIINENYKSLSYVKLTKKIFLFDLKLLFASLANFYEFSPGLLSEIIGNSHEEVTYFMKIKLYQNKTKKN